MKRQASQSGKRSSQHKISPSELIRTALTKRKKAELIDLLVEYADENIEIRRDLESRFEIEKPTNLVVTDVDIAIRQATQVDERRLNHNFDYDYGAYEAAQTGLKRLVETGEHEEAKRLSLELMKRGSYQVACSDEGMMTEEIEDCLKPVIKAFAKTGGVEAKEWATAMIAADEVGFICDTELTKIAKGK